MVKEKRLIVNIFAIMTRKMRIADMPSIFMCQPIPFYYDLRDIFFNS
jgi:hypothetical protein